MWKDHCCVHCEGIFIFFSTRLFSVLFNEIVSNFFFDKIMKTGFHWTTSEYIFLVVSMSSGQGFDHGSCVILVSRVEGSLEFSECGAVEG